MNYKRTSEEFWEVVEAMPFNIGKALTHLTYAGRQIDVKNNLHTAFSCINREIDRVCDRNNLPDETPNQKWEVGVSSTSEVEMLLEDVPEGEFFHSQGHWYIKQGRKIVPLDRELTQDESLELFLPKLRVSTCPALWTTSQKDTGQSAKEETGLIPDLSVVEKRIDDVHEGELFHWSGEYYIKSARNVVPLCRDPTPDEQLNHWAWATVATCPWMWQTSQTKKGQTIEEENCFAEFGPQVFVVPLADDMDDDIGLCKPVEYEVLDNGRRFAFFEGVFEKRGPRAKLVGFLRYSLSKPLRSFDIPEGRGIGQCAVTDGPPSPLNPPPISAFGFSVRLDSYFESERLLTYVSADGIDRSVKNSDELKGRTDLTEDNLIWRRVPTWDEYQVLLEALKASKKRTE